MVAATARDDLTRTSSRQPTRELLEIPDPDGKYRNFADYIRHCVHVAGSAKALGDLVGFSTGSRIGDWLRGQGGRPSISSCLRLAKLSGDSPLAVLTMAGYTEEVLLLRDLMSNSLDLVGFTPLQKVQALQTVNEMEELTRAMRDMIERRLAPEGVTR